MHTITTLLELAVSLLCVILVMNSRWRALPLSGRILAGIVRVHALVFVPVMLALAPGTSVMARILVVSAAVSLVTVIVAFLLASAPSAKRPWSAWMPTLILAIMPGGTYLWFWVGGRLG
jgi:hypothetical protein